MSLSSKNWVFTLNCPKHFTEEEFFKSYDSKELLNRFQAGNIDYGIFQLERGGLDGRLHYQGYIEISTKTSMGKVKKLFDINFIHLEIRRGTQQQARDYCQK